MIKKTLYALAFASLLTNCGSLWAAKPANMKEIKQLLRGDNVPKDIGTFLQEHAPNLVKYLTGSAYEAALFSAIVQADKLIVVKFYSNGCGPCKRMKPIMEAIAHELSDDIIVINVELNTNTRPILRKFDARGIPTFIFFKNGKKVGQYTGALSQSSLTTKIKRLL